MTANCHDIDYRSGSNRGFMIRSGSARCRPRAPTRRPLCGVRTVLGRRYLARTDSLDQFTTLLAYSRENLTLLPRTNRHTTPADISKLNRLSARCQSAPLPSFLHPTPALAHDEQNARFFKKPHFHPTFTLLLPYFYPTFTLPLPCQNVQTPGHPNRLLALFSLPSSVEGRAGERSRPSFRFMERRSKRLVTDKP